MSLSSASGLMPRLRRGGLGCAMALLAACTTVEEPPRVIQDAPGSPAVRPAAASRRDPAPQRFDPRAFQAPGATAGAGAATSSEPAAGGDTQRRALIRLELASALYQQGSHARALDEVRAALAIDPGLAAAHGMLGLIYMDLRDQPQAEASFRRALAISPNDSELRNNYGWFLCQTGRLRESIPEFMAALRDPLYVTPARPLHNAGLCSLRLGDESAAQDYFQKAFQLDPSNPVSMYHLAEIHLRRNQLDQADFHAQRLLGSYPPSAETLWLGIRVARKRDDRQALNSLSVQLRRQFPNSREAMLLQQGNFGD
ncbi:MAG: type IV pilus biogenesis/stability protein PilW [Burkholderiaceae bacterium]